MFVVRALLVPIGAPPSNRQRTVFKASTQNTRHLVQGKDMQPPSNDLWQTPTTRKVIPSVKQLVCPNFFSYALVNIYRTGLPAMSTLVHDEGYISTAQATYPCFVFQTQENVGA